MPARYHVQVIHEAADDRIAALDHALKDKLREHGLQEVIELTIDPTYPKEVPTLALFFGSTTAASDSNCVEAARAALSAGNLVVPLVSRPDEFTAQVPGLLHPFNAHFWEPDGARGLARFVLEELGIEERQRRVFISHCRDDALVMAEQLHDQLSHHRFLPFIDRFAIRPGPHVQEEIADALEEFAFLLLVESPCAAESRWVSHEVGYALSHQLGICILSWPEAPDVPGTAGLARVQLAREDLLNHRGYQILTDEVLARVLACVEEAHARGLVRRRQSLLVNVQDAAAKARKSYITLPGWRLLVGEEPAEVVGVAARLPGVEDLFALDKAATQVLGGETNSVLVHAARRLRQGRRDLLTWAVGDRSITLVPENAVGAYW